MAIPFSAFAATLRHDGEAWYSVNNVAVEKFTVDGGVAYCVEPQIPSPPNGEYKETQINNSNLLKVLYYGYGGKGFSAAIKSKMDSYHNNNNITASGEDLYYSLTRSCAVKAFGKDASMSYYDDWNTAINSMYSYLTSQPTPSGCKAFVINTSDYTQTIAFIVHDKEILLQIHKFSADPSITDGNSCYSLRGAVYGVYTDAACTKKIGEITTNANGYGFLQKRVSPDGKYYAKEIKAPEGYALSDEVLQFKDVGNISKATGLNIHMAYPYDIPKNDPVRVVVKKIGDSGKPLENAEFTVKHYPALENYESTNPKTWVIKTDKDGDAFLTSEYLVSGDEFYMTTTGNPCFPLGTVTIQETKAPEGYKLNDKLYEFKITGESSDTAFVEEFNTPIVTDDTISITLTKKDENGKLLPGAHVQLLDSKHNVVKDWITSNEPYVVNDLTPGETYIYHEVEAPAGYAKAKDVTFTFDGNTDKTVSMTDLLTETYISKKDVTGDNELEGAKLKVVDSNKNVVDEWTSTKEPHCIKGLVAGKTYTLTETISPNGYSIAQDIQFTVKDDGSATFVEMKDELTVTVVSKKDITNNDELPGATLQVIDENDNVVEEWVSTDKPHTIKGLVAGKTYKLVETIAPKGYAMATADEFTVNEDGSTTFVELINAPTVTTVSKKDITGDSELPGAGLQIVDEDGNVVEEWTSTDEPHTIKGLEAGKTYKLIEVISPDGYTIANDIEFTINEDGSATYVEMKDDVTRYQFIKVDEENKPIKGAKLQILDETGKVVEEWTTDGTAHVIAGKLIVGKKYTLHEAEAPEGYDKAEDITFEVGNTSELQTVTMVDKYNGDVRISTPDQPVTPSNSYNGNGFIKTGQQFPFVIAGVVVISALVIVLFRKRRENI
jgi:uncharacterized surface anchored protein